MDVAFAHREAVLFSALERAPEAEEFRRARRRRDVALGFLGGCALAVIATAADIAWRGWHVLFTQAPLNLMLFPFLCGGLALSLSREPGERWSLGPVRLRIGTLMLLIAYLAVFLEVIVEGQRIGGPALRYHGQQLCAREMATLFRNFARKFAREAPMRRNNARELRAGRIPDGIQGGQKTFLKSLETSATPEYRTYRYGLIADGEDRSGQLAESNVAGLGKLTDYYDQLAQKYARAEQRPWEPVPPDPPRP